MITQELALEIAQQELANHGHVASEYEISIDEEGSDQEQWIVLCEKRGPFPVPGGSHVVLVNRATGKARFLVGE